MRTTLRSLATFSLSAEMDKYSAIIPVVLGATYPALNVFNVARLTSPRSAIVSGVIVNAVVVGPLLLVAILGMKPQRHSASSLLRSRLLFYGLVGMLLPWAVIKVIDVCLNAWR